MHHFSFVSHTVEDGIHIQIASCSCGEPFRATSKFSAKISRDGAMDMFRRHTEKMSYAQ